MARGHGFLIGDMYKFVKYGSKHFRNMANAIQVREIKYRGLVTVGMIYDNSPIVDSFRYTDENTVLGAIENKNVENNRPVWFYMKRL